MPRPSKLTDETASRILTALRTGCYMETAAAFAGIHKSTLHDWLKRGRSESKGRYREFSYSVEKALAESELRDLAVIARASERQWQASAWRLERRWPQRWARRSPVTEVEEEAPRLGVSRDVMPTDDPEVDEAARNFLRAV